MQVLAPSQAKRIDVLKGVAILAVFIYHAQLCLFPGFESRNYGTDGFLLVSGTRSLLLNLSPTAYGWAGVQLFLLISGFLIHLNFLAAGGSLDKARFFKKRFWRIYPPYLLVLLLLCAASGRYYFFSMAGIKDLLAHLLLLHNLSERSYYSINASFWSLALEAQLYLLYPAFLYARNKWGAKNTLIILIILAVVLLALGAAFNFFGAYNVYPSNVFIYWFVWAAGAFWAEKFFNGQRIFGDKAAPIIVVCFIITILCRYHLYSSPLIFISLPLGLVAFFEWSLYIKSKRIFLAPVKWLAFVGICSYSIYLVHQPALGKLLSLITPSVLKYSPWRVLALIPAFGIICFVSYGLYQWVERKSIAIGKKRDTIEPVKEKAVPETPLGVST